MSTTAYIRGIEYYLPEKKVTNEDLMKLHPSWDLSRIKNRTGVISRRHAAQDELASDLGFRAATRLFETSGVGPKDIQALVYCTQSPDYIMPANSALLHAKLGFGRDVAAFDLTLACSGFVYAAAISKSLIDSLGYENVLVVTADTYSKYIHPDDKPTVTLFGDAGAAAIFSRSTGESGIIDIALGTDGKGADKFMIPAGGLRRPKCAETALVQRDIAGNLRTPENIHMDGTAVVEFVKRDVPYCVHQILDRNKLKINDLDLVVFHQASRLALDTLSEILEIPPEKTFSNLAELGNTVSASLPIVLKDAEKAGRLPRGSRVLVVGFGVGFSWGSCLFKW